MLVISQLSAWRGSTCLFEDLDFSVPEGSLLCLRGANGSGKTTLLRIICGLTRAERGSISWRNRLCRDGLRNQACYSGHQTGLSQDLTVQQNLAFLAAVDAWPANWPATLAPLGIEACMALEVRRLSAGQRRRAALARVLLSAAPVWLLDEPFANLDVAGRAFMEKRIEEHVSSGGTAIIAAHEDLSFPGVPVSALTLGGKPEP